MTFRGYQLVTLGAFLAALACQREETRGKYSKPAPSGAELDAMQMSSARRVALESARAALQRRDLGRLKQLSVWVRERANVAIFEKSDLRALDLAIGCLERASTAEDALAELERLDSGTLAKPAREACRGAQ